MRIEMLLFALLQNYITLDNVTINGTGPYRFLVDTGTQSTIINEALARKLLLVPAYRVSLSTPTGSELVPATTVTRVTAGEFGAEAVEVLWYDLPSNPFMNGPMDGILGHNFLSRFDYILDFKKRALSLAPPATLAATIRGERLPFRFEEGRILLQVRFAKDGSPQKFILDSGASHVVVPGEFGELSGMQAANSARLQTAIGETEVTTGTIPFLIVGDIVFRNLIASRDTQGQYGLLPATLFESIYVNSKERYLILNGKF
jgi:predicted aspartyl protease